MELYNNVEVPRFWKITYGSILIISQISAVIIPLLYLSSRKCRHHPASIVLILCILEMVSTHQLYMQSICLPELLGFTNFKQIYEFYTFQDILNNRAQIEYQMCWWNQSIYVTCVSAQLCYYIVLCVDLIVTLKNPFQNSSTRIQNYHIFSVFITSLFYGLVLKEVQEQCQKAQCQGDYIKIEFDSLIILQVIFIVVASVSFYYGFHNLILIRKLDSQLQETKKKYIINHMLMIGAIILMWLPPAVYGFYEAKYVKASQDSLEQPPLLKASFCLLLASRKYFYYCEAAIFAMIRMREPYFYFRIKFLLLTLLGKVTAFQNDEVQELEQNDDEFTDQWLIPLNQLVQEKQNRETVKHILSSILEIVDHDCYKDLEFNLDELKKQAKVKNIKEISKTNTYGRLSRQKDASENNLQPFLINDGSSMEITRNNSSQYINSSLKYLVEEYAPEIFQYLRELDGITQKEFQKSLDINLNEMQIKKTQESLGRSGSFFFFSHDQKFILKTLKYSELQTLINTLLPSYSKYIYEKNQTLIAKIYGAYTVDVEGLASIHLVLMENTTSAIPKINSRYYDIKGSLYNRYVNKRYPLDDGQSFASSQHNRISIIPDIVRNKILPRQFDRESQNVVFKDVNFIESNDLFLELSPQMREEFMDMLKSDSDLLESLNIMDYSLFVCINDQKTKGSTKSLSENDLKKTLINNQFRRIFIDGKIISLSVIDILQKYDFNKQLEYQYKAFFTNEPHLISCVDADQYRQRFLAFVNSVCTALYEYQ